MSAVGHTVAGKRNGRSRFREGGFRVLLLSCLALLGWRRQRRA